MLLEQQLRLAFLASYLWLVGGRQYISKLLWHASRCIHGGMESSNLAILVRAQLLNLRVIHSAVDMLEFNL